MKLLVTGGSGFIGSNFIRTALSEHPDYEVINLDKLGTGSNQANLMDLRDDERYTFVRGSTTDSSLVCKLVRNAATIVNFAAETHVDRSIAEPYPFFESNTMGTLTLLEAIRRCNPEAKLIHVSTDEVYGEVVEGSSRETDTLRPSSPYAASKAGADLAALAYHRTFGLDVVISRSSNNFGPYQFPEKFIPKTIIRAALNLKIPVYGSGRHIRDWIYVADHCDALDTLIRKGEPGEIYNISAGNEYENIEVVKKVQEIMGKKDLPMFVEDRPGHDVRYSLSSRKMQKQLGWKPRSRFDEALQGTVEWYLGNDWWWRTLADEQVLHPTPWKLAGRV